ncbi:MAG: L-threonine 3-dehydrogenase, partial [Alistipes sp.]|nr:L-threonine 3-dehydrogenase [Alistipes sp.]
ALNAFMHLLEADPAKLVHRNSFNITAMSFSPEEIYDEIRKHRPDFTMKYDVDPGKEAIARSWPDSLDDSCAREQWGWSPKWNLADMTADMLTIIERKRREGLLI